LNIIYVQTNKRSSKDTAAKPRKHPIFSPLQQTTQRAKQPFLFFVTSQVNGSNPLIGSNSRPYSRSALAEKFRGDLFCQKNVEYCPKVPRRYH